MVVSLSFVGGTGVVFVVLCCGVGVVVCCGDVVIVVVVVCCGDVVVGWSLWFVVVTRVVAWLLLASCFETKDGVLTMIVLTETTNDDIVTICCLVATSPMATWHLPFHQCGQDSFAW